MLQKLNLPIAPKAILSVTAPKLSFCNDTYLNLNQTAWEDEFIRSHPDAENDLKEIQNSKPMSENNLENKYPAGASFIQSLVDTRHKKIYSEEENHIIETYQNYEPFVAITDSILNKQRTKIEKVGIFRQEKELPLTDKENSKAVDNEIKSLIHVLSKNEKQYLDDFNSLNVEKTQIMRGGQKFDAFDFAPLTTHVLGKTKYYYDEITTPSNLTKRLQSRIIKYLDKMDKLPSNHIYTGEANFKIDAGLSIKALEFNRTTPHESIRLLKQHPERNFDLKVALPSTGYIDKDLPALEQDFKSLVKNDILGCPAYISQLKETLSKKYPDIIENK
ncbi:MAG: hypothetical protein WCK67_09125 [bacterium]